MEVRQAGVGETPRTRYAQARDGAHLAYQVFGDGVIPLVMAQGQASHLEHQWDFPVQTQFLRRLGQLAARGGVRPARLRRLRPEPRSRRRLGRASCGRSHRGHGRGRTRPRRAVRRVPQWARCIRAAVEHPDRIADLLLMGSYSRWMRAPDYPAGMPEEATARMLDVVTELWGTGRTIEFFAPVLAADDRQRELFGQYERMATSPGEVRDLIDAVGAPGRPTPAPAPVGADADPAPAGRSDGARGTQPVPRRPDPRRAGTRSSRERTTSWSANRSTSPSR